MDVFKLCLIVITLCGCHTRPVWNVSTDPAKASSLSSQSLSQLSSGKIAHGQFAPGKLANVDELRDWESLSSNVNTVKQGPQAGSGPMPSTLNHTVAQASFSSVPLHNVLHALAHDAGVRLQLNESFTEPVTLLAEAKPIAALLAELSLQVPLYWREENSLLRVWGDRRFTESYTVNYLNLDRSTRSRVGLATQVGTINSSVDEGVSGASNSSQTALENSADHHFWHSLNSDLEKLINDGQTGERSRFSINRDAGLVLVHANASIHFSIQDYLQKLNRNAHKQVMIEATVVEVTLSNRYQAGVDWRLLSNGTNGINAKQVLSSSPHLNEESINRITAPAGLVSLIANGRNGDLLATLNLIEQFGDVRILSKPRIIALNNQSSVLKVVDNRVYFTVNVERARSETKDEVITETEIHTVPVGLVMNVTPYIDDDDGVMLNVRPTLSRILGFVNDPNPELAAAAVRNSVPEIQVREMESMLRVKSGEIAVIGGLMQELSDRSRRQLPLLSELPIIGKVFGDQSRQTRQTELLIVLKPTVLG